MRTLCILACTLTALTLAACGGGTTGDDVNLQPDANTTTHPDANTPAPDAASNETAAGLGNMCTGQAGECPTTTPDCISFNGTDGFCTLSCGTSADNMTQPVGGDAACANGYTGTATPGCIGVDACTGGTCNWSCALECGTMGTTDLGTCPANLTCTNNICGG